MTALFRLIALLASLNANAGPAPAAPEEGKPVSPAMEILGRMVGGTWRTTGNFVAEFTYEWRVKGRAIRAVGVIAKGTKDEFPSEALYGWDAEAGKVYYLDCHSDSTVYRGWAEAKDGKFTGEFDGLIGAKGHYRFEAELPDNDTLLSTLYGQKSDGTWAKLHTLRFVRKRG